MRVFIKTTIIGGLVFLLPLAIISVLLDHALRFALKGVEPVSHALRLEQMGKVAGIGAATLIAITLLVLVAFAAGLAARTRFGYRLSQWLEAINGEWVTVFVPQAPTPLSGNVMYLPKGRIRAMDIGIVEAMTIVRHIGAGSRAALKSVDLTPPADQ
ncbi:hypothetical protein ACWIEX_00205 [Bosea sp. NPDC055353]